MTVLWTDIRDLPSGEFSSLSQTVIENSLTEANLLVNADFFGDLYDTAIKYMTAHLLVKAVQPSGSSAPAGPVTSVQQGPMRVDYATSSTTTSIFDTTVYGQQYKMLVKSLVWKGPRAV